MKHLSKTLIAVLLAVLTAILLPAQVFADSTEEKYVSEVEIGVGKSAAEAEKALEGYEILKDDKGKYVDLNKSAGATGTGSKGDRVVYMGFKKTASVSEAITDLAVMNMKGGYSVEDYEALMEDNMKDQIIPFVDSFLAAIEEYRENCNSSNAANKKRASYIRDLLNKFTDDDCGGKGLGDLLLNETKYEMGDSAYGALSDAEKKNHADILTIVAQANGMATLMIENLLTRAADTGEGTWIERFTDVTYEDLLDEVDLPPSRARKALDLEYQDDAMEILDMWDAFKAQLDGYDAAVARLEEAKNRDLSEQQAIVDHFDIKTATEKEIADYAKAVAELKQNAEIISNCYADVLCKEYLEGVPYGDASLLDFFTSPGGQIEEDITVLYPLVAALSPGQRAGLAFVTLQQLVMIGSTDETGYVNAELEEKETTSIYLGVNREIYQKNGVALTSDALRTKAVEKMNSENNAFVLSVWTCTMIGLTFFSAVAFGISARMKVTTLNAISKYNATAASLSKNVANIKNGIKLSSKPLAEGTLEDSKLLQNKISDLKKELEAAQNELNAFESQGNIGRLQARSSMCSKLMIGFGVAMIILLSISVYFTYQDMVNRYKVDFTPIPRYMVDEKDITGFNRKGEKIVLKNQAAYYKAVLCNRKAGDEMFKKLDNVADLNGDVGRQWLALYAARNEAETPILADSFKFTNAAEIPAGYKTGIHAFGTDAAENLNNTLYVWNSAAPKVYVYFRTEEAGAGTTGSVFSTGTIALVFASGLAAGVLATVLVSKTSKRRKENAVPAA